MGLAGAVGSATLLAGMGIYTTFAQSPSPSATGTPATVTTTTPSTSTTTPSTSTTPATSMPPKEGRGGPGGPHAAPNTAAGAAAEISAAQAAIASAKLDLTAAGSKVDSTKLSAVLSTANSLVTKAQSAATAANYTVASQDARAAHEAANGVLDVADDVLGTAAPSYATRPQPPTAPSGAPAVNTQGRAGHELSAAYADIVGVHNASSSNSDAAALQAEAVSLYNQAYSDYQSGKYTAAAAEAHDAHHFAEAASNILQAAGVTVTPSPAVSKLPF